MFKFDGEESLAIRCPFVPALYVSHKNDIKLDQWYVRILRPPKTDRYEFIFETAKYVSTCKLIENLFSHLLSFTGFKFIH